MTSRILSAFAAVWARAISSLAVPGADPRKTVPVMLTELSAPAACSLHPLPSPSGRKSRKTRSWCCSLTDRLDRLFLSSIFLWRKPPTCRKLNHFPLNSINLLCRFCKQRFALPALLHIHPSVHLLVFYVYQNKLVFGGFCFCFFLNLLPVAVNP